MPRCFVPFEKWREQKHAAATGSAASFPGAWPQICVRGGELPRVVNEAEAALLALGREVYQRGDLVVRPVLSKLKAANGQDTQSWRLVPVTRPWLVEALTCAARFLKYDGRSQKFAAVNAPHEVAETYLGKAPGTCRRLPASPPHPFYVPTARFVLRRDMTLRAVFCSKWTV
jgi:hypothetical protein